MLLRLGRNVLLPDESHEPLVDALPIYVRGRFVTGDPLPEPERYRFVLGPTVPRGVLLKIYGDRFETAPTSDGAESHAVLTMRPQTYVLIFMSRLGWRQVLDAGDVAVSGRQDAADHLAAWFGLT